VDWLESWDSENRIRSVPKLGNNETSRPVRSSELVKDRNLPKRWSKSGRGSVDEVRESQEFSRFLGMTPGGLLLRRAALGIAGSALDDSRHMPKGSTPVVMATK
jgi:hypothetical protein